MKITSIWGTPIWPSKGGYTFRERLNRTGEWAMQGIAHRLPRKLAYWSFIDSGVRTMGNDVVPDARYVDLLKRLEGDLR